MVFGVSATAIGAWLCLRRLGGLPWFSFASATKTFVVGYRDALETSALFELAVLASLPFLALGPAVLLAVPGLRALKKARHRGARRGIPVSAGERHGRRALAVAPLLHGAHSFRVYRDGRRRRGLASARRMPDERRIVRYAVASLVVLTFVHLAKALWRVLA